MDKEFVEAWMLLHGFQRQVTVNGERWLLPPTPLTWEIKVDATRGIPKLGEPQHYLWSIRPLGGEQRWTHDNARALSIIQEMVSKYRKLGGCTPEERQETPIWHPNAHKK